MNPTARYYAVRTLLDNGFKTLPVTQEQIQEILISSGWEILHFDTGCASHMEVLKKYNLVGLAGDRKAFSYAGKGIKLVCVKAGLSNNERRLLLAHELGHIVMGHISLSGVLSYTPMGLLVNPQEDEANAFALEFLAPVCVLAELGIRKVRDIAHTTLLEERFTREVAREVNLYRCITPDEMLLRRRFAMSITDKMVDNHN